MVSQSSKREWLVMTRKGPWKEREVWVRGRDCSSLITLQWLSFGYQFPWWSVYFLPPWGLRLSEIFLGYIFNVSQLNNAISLLWSLVRRLRLIYAWYARKSSSADWRTTTWQWNLEIVCHYEVSLYFSFLYQLLEEKKSFIIPRSSINEGSNPQWSIELALRHSARVIIYIIFKV